MEEALDLSFDRLLMLMMMMMMMIVCCVETVFSDVAVHLFVSPFSAYLGLKFYPSRNKLQTVECANVTKIHSY